MLFCLRCMLCVSETHIGQMWCVGEMWCESKEGKCLKCAKRPTKLMCDLAKQAPKDSLTSHCFQWSCQCQDAKMFSCQKNCTHQILPVNPKSFLTRSHLGSAFWENRRTQKCFNAIKIALVKLLAGPNWGLVWRVIKPGLVCRNDVLHRSAELPQCKLNKTNPIVKMKKMFGWSKTLCSTNFCIIAWQEENWFVERK